MTFPSQRVAVIGVGIMGSAIARRLLECGHTVRVFDLDTAKVAALEPHGAHVAGTAAMAAAEEVSALDPLVRLTTLSHGAG